MFVDLKTAFDSVDRGGLIRAMRKGRIKKGLIVRVKETSRRVE